MRKQMRSILVANVGFSGLHRLSSPLMPREALTGDAPVIEADAGVGVAVATPPMINGDKTVVGVAVADETDRVGVAVTDGATVIAAAPGMISTCPTKIRFVLTMLLVVMRLVTAILHLSAMRFK